MKFRALCTLLACGVGSLIAVEVPTAKAETREQEGRRAARGLIERGLIEQGDVDDRVAVVYLGEDSHAGTILKITIPLPPVPPVPPPAPAPPPPSYDQDLTRDVLRPSIRRPKFLDDFRSEDGARESQVLRRNKASPPVRERLDSFR